MDAEYADVYPDLYRRHWWWRVREGILLSKISSLLGGAAGDARILDVGCGAGLFFDALTQFGEVEGIESDANAVRQSGRWQSRIHVGHLDDSYTAHRGFDLILMLDILEHVPDPDQLLRSAGRLLTPRGSIVITVPAFNWLWTSHDNINQHLRRYGATQLRRTVTNAGLVPTETKYLFQSLVLPKLVIRAGEAMRSDFPDVPRVPPPALNQALQTWYRLESAIAGWLPFGSSLMTIARQTHV